MWFGTPFDYFAHPNSIMSARNVRDLPTHNGEFKAPAVVARWPSWPPVIDVTGHRISTRARTLDTPDCPEKWKPFLRPNNFNRADSARGEPNSGVGTGDFDALTNYRCPRHAPG